ncbi:MAG: MFS transporter [Bacteroidetes bacterium]|nr:MFS transporter [Bacteroidota bacterium]
MISPIQNLLKTHRMKKYYCWVVLACLFLMYMASNGIALNTFNLYLPEFAKAFKVDIAKATGLAATLYLVLALPLPFVGRMLERFPARSLILTGAVGATGALFLFATARSFETVRLFTLLYPICLSLVGLLTSMYVINNWFVRYRGLATGILLMASSVGPAVFAPLVGQWIKELGWETAALYQALICSAMILIPALLVVSHPSKVGTFADGIEGTVGRQPQSDPMERSRIFRSAVRSSDFYLLAFVTAALWFSIAGFIQNQRNYQADLQLDVAQSGLLQGLFFFCGLLGKLLFGWLGDRFEARRIMLLSVANMVIGCVLLYLSLDDKTFMAPCAVVFGIGYSGTFTMIQLYIISLFGGASYGTILGILSFIDTLAASMGVAVLGSMRKAGGSYHGAFGWMIALTLASLAATYYINLRATRKGQASNPVR